MHLSRESDWCGDWLLPQDHSRFDTMLYDRFLSNDVRDGHDVGSNFDSFGELHKTISLKKDAGGDASLSKVTRVQRRAQYLDNPISIYCKWAKCPYLISPRLLKYLSPCTSLFLFFFSVYRLLQATILYCSISLPLYFASLRAISGVNYYLPTIILEVKEKTAYCSFSLLFILR